eukprot:Lithocolla_globosa_v1_NODE_72_length_6942_cov_12.745027.p1 type:complete len:1457 gc:universal NODE_72_length_6942_cov_12.745027:1493-5863(+)
MITNEIPQSSFAVSSYVSYLVSDQVFLEEHPNLDVKDTIAKWQDGKTKNMYEKEVKVVKFLPTHDFSELLEILRSGGSTSAILSSSFLLSAIPTMFQVAAEKLPCVFEVPARLESDNDYSGIMIVRQSGFAILSSANAQEAHDMTVLSHLLTIKASYPFLHFFNRGESASVKLQTALTLRTCMDHDALTAHKSRNPENLNSVMFTSGDSEGTPVISICDTMMKEMEGLFGKRYQLFEYVGSANPTKLVVMFNASSTNMEKLLEEKADQSIGLIKVRFYRPWSNDHFIKSIPGSVRKMIVVDESHDLNGTSAWGPLFLDVAGALHSNGGETPLLLAARLAGCQMCSGIAKKVVENLEQAKSATALVCNHCGPPAKYQMDMPSANTGEESYVNMLKDVFSSRLVIANSADHPSIWGTEKPADRTSSGNAEFGFGLILSQLLKRKRFSELVNSVLKNVSIQMSLPLRSALTAWYQVRDTSSPKEEEDLFKQLENEKSTHPLLQKIANMKEIAPKKSNWLIGGGSWAYDLADSGVHHVLSSGENINMLVIETDNLNNPQGPTLAKRKKDIGLYAMNYGGVFVASCAIYASYTQLLNSLMDADAYPGPSIVLCYAPTISKINKGQSAAMQMLATTKQAVNDGLWPLYRWNPSLENEKGKEPFLLESDKIKADLQEFLERENQLSLIVKAEPTLDSKVSMSMEDTVGRLHSALQEKAMKSYQSLLAGIAPPLLILFGSDGGNAESLSRRLESNGKNHGMNIRAEAMDDFEFGELGSEPNVLFIISTAGQGEFPGNAREFWKGLQNSTPTDLNLKDTRFAVFGLGDSHYWPRPEEKHFFCKPALDLTKKLLELESEQICETLLGDDQHSDGFEGAWNEFEPEFWSSLGVEGMSSTKKAKFSDEDNKEDSNFLRGTIAEGLLDESTGSLCERDTKITKFHGIYQQDNRDLREELRKQGKEKAFSFMIRCRIPGGVLTCDQWLAMDHLSDTYGNKSMKVTTRQTFQLHGVIKRELKKTMQGINHALMDTIAACGDVNRNVLSTPLPMQSHVHEEVYQFSKKLSEHLLPSTSAYHEIWMDKVLIKDDGIKDVEPLYGPRYLPRKFKAAVAIPPLNDTDIFTNCLGFIAIIEEDKVIGYNVSVGGGMGTTHNNKKTFPRLADILGFCTPEQAVDVGEKVMLVQRDHGDRTNRKHARVKYTVDDHGIDWYRERVEEMLGYSLQPAKPFEFTRMGDRLGWSQDWQGNHHYCMFLENGRVQDTKDSLLKTALRELAHMQIGHFRLTANQNLILSNIKPEEKSTIVSFLNKYNIENSKYSGLRLNSMACVALPTCGLALAESERYLPKLLSDIDDILIKHDLRDDEICLRMTGCPNGCARPFNSEIGFVGRAPGIYNMYLGASYTGDRLNKLYKESVNEAQILEELDVLISNYAKNRKEGERFGDFCVRTGIIKASPGINKPALAGIGFHD